MFSTEKTLSFLELLHRFQRVERVAYVPGTERMENDVEHSYQLAMLAWYLIDSLALPLERDRAIRYALTHDLVEAYAGDTYIFDAQAAETKVERERRAAQLLKTTYPEFSDLHRHISAYEWRDDAESAFVFALDKLLWLFNDCLCEWRTAKEKAVSFETLYANKLASTAAHPDVKQWFAVFTPLIREGLGVGVDT